MSTAHTAIEVKPLSSNLRALVDSYYAAQKARISWGNRISALERGRDVGEDPKILQAKSYQEEFQKLEEKAHDEILMELERYPVWSWLKTVKGIGPTLAGKLLCDIDIRKAERISNLWSFAGQGLKDGKAQRPVKGEKLPYSTRLRTACFLVSRSFLMCRSPYARLYGEAKLYYAANRKDWTKLHIDLAARRKMIKVFLSHLWLKWREAEGLPISMPYPIEHLEHHTHVYKPEDFAS